MNKLRESCLITIFLLVSFIAAFLLTTAVTDFVARNNGYYQEGIDAERGLYQ